MPPLRTRPRRSRPKPSLPALATFIALSPFLLARTSLALPESQSPAPTSPALPGGLLGLEAVGSELTAVEDGRELNARRGLEERAGDGRAAVLAESSATSPATPAAAAATTTGSTPHAPVTTASLAQSVITSVPSSIDGAGVGSSTSLAVAASSSGTGASTATTTSTGVISTSTAVPAGYDLPEAFDSTLGNNFTSTACPSFFATFLANPTFKSCAPFSLLLTTSTGFFQAERAPYGLLPYVLNASCTASQNECTGLMDSLAAKIQLQNTCGPDLAKGNPLAIEALNGFRSYRLMREAGCQTSNTTGRYCFAEASAKTNPSDLYYYYLPEGTSLPSGATPDCDACTQNLLTIYARYATNTTLAIYKTYASGRAAAALACGPNFAPLVVTSTAGQKSASSVTIYFDRRQTVLAAGLGILGALLLAT
ncbi:hypothetical protein NBRC10513_003203 [Rhodotorula toruloides]|uniref:DUF7729 domain-containing protein n=1 Tax=Rhodotorula toruloides TaxID=5286 RepID=A0A2S9ZWW5_RHOTO|nr:hypothetical protein AAT19DRAFT_11482 [Rhodotorula toruloides]